MLLAFIMIFSFTFGWVPSESAKAADVKPTVSKPQVEAANDRILVKIKEGQSLQELLRKYSLKLIETIGKWGIVEVPSLKVEVYQNRLLADPVVESVELDYIHATAGILNDPYINEQWHLTKMSLPRAWDITTLRSNKTIAVLDTGISLYHPEFRGKIVAGIDTVNNDSSPSDDNGHGTHVSGVAAANGNNGIGVSGVDPSAKIMPVKVLNSQGKGYTSNIIRGLYYAADNKANVVLMPYTSSRYSLAYQEAIRYAWNKGMVIVAPAGNEGTSEKKYPAAYKNVLSVAATNQQDRRASFSNYGNGWVDVAAPGQSIYATSAFTNNSEYIYTSMSGTSMASAAVAGIVSLTWSMNPGRSNSQVSDHIMSTTDYVGGSGTEFVYGRVNAFKAVNGF